MCRMNLQRGLESFKRRAKSRQASPEVDPGRENALGRVMYQILPAVRAVTMMLVANEMLNIAVPHATDVLSDG